MSAPAKLAVIGGGISGLAAAHRLVTAAEPDAVEVTLFESGERFGGWIRTEQFAGRPVDFGPDSLLARTPWAIELCEELGMRDELVAPGGGGAYLWSRGELRTLPSGILAGLPGGPRPFLRSGLMSRRGMARASLDLVLPGNAPAGDESVGALIRRRLGAEALERVIDPLLLGGVHAGRCDELSLAATAPQIAAAARADRSLLRGLRKTAPAPAKTGAPPAPIFVGPRGGMQRIVDALEQSLGASATLRAGVKVTGVGSPGVAPALGGPSSLASSVAVQLEGAPAPEQFDGAILAIPAAPAASLIAPHATHSADTLRALNYASVAHVAFAYDPADVPDLPPGTGFLVPRPEGTLMTACTWIGQKWPERGDGDGRVVIKCSTGRIDDGRFLRLSDEHLAQSLHAELGTILGLRGNVPEYRILRVIDGLPQYAPGHPDRIAAVVAEVRAALPGITLTGAAYGGTSVPVCIREGRASADAQLARLGLAGSLPGRGAPV